MMGRLFGWLKSARPALNQRYVRLIASRYVDKAAADLHINSTGVQELLAWFQTVPIFAETDPPVIHSLQYLSPSFEFSRPEAAKHPDPHVVFAELDYVAGGVATATPYWKAVVETGRDMEPGTLAYGVLRDTHKEEKLATLEVYESSDYLNEVHIASDAISESIKNTQHLRTGVQHHLLRKVSGYLYKN